MVVSRGEVFLIRLDPTEGHQIKKTRPCVVLSPDYMNHAIATFLVAPLTSGKHEYPSRIPCTFEGKQGHILLDQIRVVDKRRMLKQLGSLDTDTVKLCLQRLSDFFSY